MIAFRPAPARSAADAPPERDAFVIVAPSRFGKTVLIASMENALFGDRRITSEAVELHVTEWLRRQADRIRIARVPPERSKPTLEEPESMRFSHRGREHGLIAWAGEDLLVNEAVDRAYLVEALGDATVIAVVDPLSQPEIARHTLRANAFWCQEELGLDAEQALLSSARLHWDLDADGLESLRVGFAEIRPMLSRARWSFDWLKSSPQDRYPLLDLPADEVRRVDRVLDDVVESQSRQPERANNLLRQVLPEKDRVIVTFSRLDLKAFLPGVEIDLPALSQKLVAPRPGVLVVAGPYLKTRVRRAGGTASIFYDEFAIDGPRALWHAMQSHMRPETAPRVRPRIARPRAAVAILCAISLLLSALTLGGILGPGLQAIGGISLAALAVVCVGAVIPAARRARASRPTLGRAGREAGTDGPKRKAGPDAAPHRPGDAVHSNGAAPSVVGR